MYRMLTRIVDGQGRPEDLERLDNVASKIGAVFEHIVFECSE